MHLYFLHCEIFAIKHGNINERCNNGKCTHVGSNRNPVESGDGRTSRIYFDNAGDDVMLLLHNVTLKLQKPCQHSNKCDCSKASG